MVPNRATHHIYWRNPQWKRFFCAVNAFNLSYDSQAEDEFDKNTVYRKGNDKSELFVYNQIIFDKVWM